MERPDPSLSITESCELLAASALFGHFPEEQRTSIAKRIKWKFIPGRSILFHKGERGDSMYLMASGRLALQADIERNITYEVARGDNFGELALVTDTPRTATAVALRDSVVGELEREDFMWLITK
ncbi:MAG TPA: cyclic nucleotide-binding domain-containing protein, partial [Flavobacteriales bacterium]|nr:cyclic nucleotide-binding domain-containing protein [Flavobacteriales bacterium]HQW42326.1 cyclic nucleotide-binding domain-containing protein [Flavobacteriales bacterium]